MGTARKYILSVNQSFPSGTTYINNIIYYNLLNSFSGITDNGNIYQFIYSGITLTQLSQLSSVDYKKRVSDFMSYINVDLLNIRTNLLNLSEYDEISCSPITTTTTTTSTTTTIPITTSTTTSTSTTTTLPPTTTTTSTTTTTPPPILTASPPSFDISSAPQSKVLFIVSNIPWAITNIPFFTYNWSQMSGSGDATITFNVLENFTGISRNDIISINSGGCIVPITQEGG